MFGGTLELALCLTPSQLPQTFLTNPSKLKSYLQA